VQILTPLSSLPTKVLLFTSPEAEELQFFQFISLLFDFYPLSTLIFSLFFPLFFPANLLCFPIFLFLSLLQNSLLLFWQCEKFRYLASHFEPTSGHRKVFFLLKWHKHPEVRHIHILTYSVAFSPRANYTDWGTATCRRNLVPTFVDREVSRGQRGGSPTVVNLSFLDTSI
jgi:hypothetical protein